MSQINWECSDDDRNLIIQIQKRGVTEFEDTDDMVDILMDITACHCNGTELDLNKFLNADTFNFAHDYFGIRKHISRKTGKLGNNFLPRCTKH